jgi:seryl-tRNA synthetase
MGDDPYITFRDDLINAGLLLSTGVDGLYGRSATYQAIVDAFCALIPDVADGWFEPVHFPPLLARSVFDRTDYLRSFPDLMGSVHVFHGDDRKHAELLREVDRDGDWASLLDPADVVLCSATCHPVYPLCAERRLPSEGRRFEIHGYCFRHEPSDDPARMQAFHMHELVFVGNPDDALAHRDKGLARGMELLAELGLEMDAVPANDPFFGRLGTMLAANQLDDALKLEGVTPICSAELPTAIMSANYHRDHFGIPFEIETADGETAHSACVAFGVDRITLALLKRHGLEPRAWPAATRERLFR